MISSKSSSGNDRRAHIAIEDSTQLKVRKKSIYKITRRAMNQHGLMRAEGLMHPRGSIKVNASGASPQRAKVVVAVSDF